MNTNYMIAKLATKKNGQFFKASYVSDLPMTAAAKRNGVIALKYTTGTFRKGLNYNNLKSVQQKRMDGTLPSTPEKLPWGSWDARWPGLVIEHKDKLYVRFYSSPNRPKSTYYLNGKPISKEELMALGVVQNSYWKKGDTAPDCITVNIANIQEIF